MKNFKILLITNTNSSVFHTMETGFKQSAEYAFDRIKSQSQISAFNIKLVNVNILSHVSFKEEISSKIDDEVIGIVGPAQTQLLLALLENSKFKDVPIFSPLATASFLSKVASEKKLKNFFQTTSTDFMRVNLLLKEIKFLYPDKKIFYYFPNDDPKSYSIGLKNDLEEIIKSDKEINSEGYEFEVTGNGIKVNKLPESGCPVIICAPSKLVCEFSKFIRNRFKRNQIFTFGSNTNLLKHHLVGSIVVCDLDRSDSDHFIQHHLKELLQKHENPSLSTLVAFHLIFQSIKEKEELLQGENDIRKQRKLLVDYINKSMFTIFNQNISFSQSGHSTIKDYKLLRISNTLLTPRFRKNKSKVKLAPKIPKSVDKWTIIGGIVAILGVLAKLDTITSFIENLIKYFTD